MAETHMDWLLQLIAYLKDNNGLSGDANGEIIQLAQDMKITELNRLSDRSINIIDDIDTRIELKKTLEIIGLSDEASSEITKLAQDMEIEKLTNLSDMATRLIELQMKFSVPEDREN
tara:strand:+ start:2005 stop:2355 length:351 start_codon:yes stop_codon:yes gene_type:complete